MADRISGFQITRNDDEYLISFDTEGGPRLELSASYEQLDLIAEAIDAQLDGDEEDALGVDGDEQ